MTALDDLTAAASANATATTALATAIQALPAPGTGTDPDSPAIEAAVTQINNATSVLTAALATLNTDEPVVPPATTPGS